MAIFRFFSIQRSELRFTFFFFRCTISKDLSNCGKTNFQTFIPRIAFFWCFFSLFVVTHLRSLIAREVYAHIYYSHFHKIVSLGEEAHLNTCFKHFYYFITEFNLVDKKELLPLQELIDNLTKEDNKLKK